MKHYENKDAYAYPELADASQTNSSSQVQPNGSKMIWQMPLVAKTYGEATVAVHTDTNHSLKFLSDGSVLPSPNGFPSNGVALNTKQGIIDLELPADHYIDDDNTSDNKPIDFLGVDSGTKPPNGAEGLGRFNDNSSTSGLLTTNKPGGCHVADLNEPITGMHMGGTNGSVSRGLPYTLENSWRQSAVRSSTANFGFNKEYSKEKHTDEGTSSNFLDASAKLRQEEKPLIDKGKDKLHLVHLYLLLFLSCLSFYVYTINITSTCIYYICRRKSHFALRGKGSLWNLGGNVVTTYLHPLCDLDVMPSWYLLIRIRNSISTACEGFFCRSACRTCFP